MKKNKQKTDLKKSILSINQKILFSFLLVFIFGLGFGAKASAASYCVKATGSATKVNSVVANAAACTVAIDAASMSMATFNANTYTAGDTVYFTAQGGSFATGITVPSSGSDNSHRITYQGINDGAGSSFPIIAISSSGSIDTNYHSYINISGFSVQYAGSAASSHVKMTGAYSHITLSNLTINGNGYGYPIVSASNVDDITLDSIAISNPGLYSVWFSGASNSNVTISNLTTSGGRGMLLQNIAGLTLSNVTSNATIAPYDSLRILQCSGIVVITNYLSSSSADFGLNIDTCNLSAGSAINGLTISSANSYGLHIINTTASSLVINNPVITNNGSYGIHMLNVLGGASILNGSIHDNVGQGFFLDQVPNAVVRGFNPQNITNGGIYNNAGGGVSILATSGNSNGVIVDHNYIHDNGSDDSSSGNRDGIDAHLNCTGLQIYENIIVRNGNAGLAFVNNSSGTVYNNVIMNNGTKNSTYHKDRGGYYNVGTGAWTLKNNIFQGNYGSEIYGGASGLAATISDHNMFLHSGNYITTEPLVYNNSTATPYTLATWQSTYNQDINSINADPLFIDASTDFHLRNTSPAINAGTDVGLAADYAGNPISGPSWDIGAYEFQDSTKPTTTANIVSGTYNQVQQVTLTCDDGAGVGCDKTYYTLDGNDPTTSSTQYSGAVSTPDNATTTLKFFSRDKNLNSETPIKSKIYTIDTTAPNTTINSNPDSLINTDSATFTFSASETSTFQCKMDSGAYASCASPKNYTSLAEGAHTFYVKATDSATNEDLSPASYAFAVDTQIPTISDLSPNNTTLSVTTTSTNLTLKTSETTTCKYSTVSGVDYALMTAFDSTNNTTHSTNISGLNSGTTYNYYIKCKDQINESSESHLTFSIAPESNDISLNTIKIKIGRTINKFKDKIRLDQNKFKFQGEDDNLANGTIKIYKGDNLQDTISADINGAWEKTMKLKDDFSGWIEVRQYDQFGTLLATSRNKVYIDTEKPEFKDTIKSQVTVSKNQRIDFPAKDNDEIDHYQVKLADVRSWRNQNDDFYRIPETIPNGTYDLFIRAYDRSGNYAEEKTSLNFASYKHPVSLASVSLNPQDNQEINNQKTESQTQSHSDKNTDINTDTATSSSNANNSSSPQPPAQPKTSHWWNPFSWF